MAAVSFPLVHPCLRSFSPHLASLFLPSTPLRRPPQHFKSLRRGSCRRLAAASSFPSSAVESDPRPAIEVSEGTSEVKKEEDLEEHRIVLPTNESSEKLLRIRHSVPFSPSSIPLVSLYFSKENKIVCCQFVITFSREPSQS